MTPVPDDISCELEAIKRQLAILRRAILSKADTQYRLLDYVMKHWLEGASEGVFKETVIGIQVFGLPADYDPKKQTIVRTNAGRLRDKLIEYYAGDGYLDPVVIEIPKGSFKPTCKPNPALALPELTPAAARLIANARAAIDKRTFVGHEAAFGYLEHALDMHPGDARLLSLKAMVHVGRAIYGRHPRTELEAAESLIGQARAQGFDTWECCYVEAEVAQDLSWDWDRARRLFERAIRGNDDVGYSPWYASHLAAQLRGDEAVSRLRQAVAHSAYHSPVIRTDLAWHEILAGSYEEARETLQSIDELFPDSFYIAGIHWAILQEAVGNHQESVAAIERVPVTIRESAITIGLRYLFLGLSGNRDKAKEGYAHLQSIKSSGEQFIPASQIACAALGAGDHESAIRWYTEAFVSERDPVVTWGAILPFNRHLYYHEGFRKLVTETLKLQLFPRFLYWVST